MRRPLLLCALAAVLPLGGCVAALIPLAAGGALAAGGTDGERAGARAAVAAPGPASEASAPGNGLTAQAISASALPAPDATAAYADAARYEAFREAALALPGTAQAEDERSSAFLMKPGGAATARCDGEPAAVLLDLDPADGLLDTESQVQANEALARVVAELRASDVDVFWISGRPAADAGAVKEQLRASGLDPADRDMLLLMRYPEDRKQSRRLEIANTHCLLAIAGDERADFDEMYEYLRNPDTPTAADALIGTRWFLIPNPLF